MLSLDMSQNIPTLSHGLTQPQTDSDLNKKIRKSKNKNSSNSCLFLTET